MLGGRQSIRSFLDGMYRLCGALAAVFLVIMLSVIVAQMVLRWLGISFGGATGYAGYCMAAATFLALGYALNSGAHIRVTLILNMSSTHRRRWLDIWCLGVSTILGWYFAFYALRANYWSWKLNDISQGLDATALWIPQLAMSAGAIVLATALTDNLWSLLWHGHAPAAEAEKTR